MASPASSGIEIVSTEDLGGGGTSLALIKGSAVVVEYSVCVQMACAAID